MRLTDEQRANIRQAVHDPGTVVGKRYGPSWGRGNDGYAEEQESLWLWVVRAVMATVERELAKANGSTDRMKSRLERAESDLAKAKIELEGWEQVGEQISHLIPEHYEASEGALMGIIADWATDAAAVVEAAKKAVTEIRSLRVRLSDEARVLVAAVDKVYPDGIDA